MGSVDSMNLVNLSFIHKLQAQTSCEANLSQVKYSTVFPDIIRENNLLDLTEILLSK